MTNFNDQKFNVEVEKRLDEIFPSKSKINKKIKKADEMRQLTPFSNLKKVLLSMEWEVTDDILSDYLNEIMSLKKLFQDNIYLKCLLQLQYIYGRLIKTYPKNVPLKTYTILYTIYNWMGKILSNNKLSTLEKKKIVKKEIRKYKEIKKYFITSKKNISQNNCYKYSVPKRSYTSRNINLKKVMKKNVNYNELSHRQYLNIVFLEMKKFIKNEIHILKYELLSGKLKPTITNESVHFKPLRKY